MAKKSSIISVDIIDLGAKRSRPFVPNGKKNHLQVGVQNTAHDDTKRSLDPSRVVGPLKVPDLLPEKTRLDFDTNNWYPFGKDNLFAEGLAAINRRAINSRSILSWKAIYTAGKGFRGKDPIVEWTDSANSDNEKFRTVFKKIIQDYNLGGNAYVEVVTDSVGSFFFMFHHDITTARLGKDDRKGFVGLFPDWSKVRGRESQIKWVPLFKDKGLEPGEDGLLHGFIHIRDYEQQFPNYGLPTWVAAMNAAAIGYKTNQWNISRLDNQFESSGVLEVFGSKSDKELLERIKKFKEKRTGEGNNGQLLVITRERGADATNYTPLIQTNEGDWIDLHKQSDQDLILAHNWFRSLSGLSEPGKLGSDTQQVRTQYELALSTVIPDTQDLILDALNPSFEELGGFDTEGFVPKNVSPVSIADRIDPNFVLTRQEAYNIFDIVPAEDDENLDRTIKVNTATPDEPRPAD